MKKISRDEWMEHFRTFGVTGKGKSEFLTGTVEVESSPEYVAQRTEEKRLAKEKHERMMASVKDALWENLETREFYPLHDTCVEFFGAAIGASELRKVFNLLPASIIGLGIQFGMDDTEVRDDMHAFVRENQSQIRALLEAK